MSYHRNNYSQREIDAFFQGMDYAAHLLNPLKRGFKKKINDINTELKLRAEDKGYAIQQTLFRLNETPERATHDRKAAYAVYGKNGDTYVASSKPKSVHIGAACSIALCIGIAIYSLKIIGVIS